MTKKAMPSNTATLEAALVPVVQERRIEIYDTTLRDGVQGEGVKLSVQDMLEITLKLDEAGVDFVEGGFPRSNRRDVEFFQRARDLDLKHTQLVAFGTPRHKDLAVDRDMGLASLIEAETPVVCLVVKAMPAQVKHVLGLEPEEYVKLVGESVRFLLKARRDQQKPLRVFVDAEHAFDGYKVDPDFVIDLLREARDRGRIVLRRSRCAHEACERVRA